MPYSFIQYKKQINMEISPKSSTQSEIRMGLVSNVLQQLALKYLVDEEAEEERLARWKGLLPRIQELKEGSKQQQRLLVNEVRKGISDQLRYKIWPMLIQKPLRSYKDCLGKCEIKDINLDLERTFPNSKESKGIEGRLKVVLNALAYAIPDVGYCQGMNFIVGTLLLRVSDEEAFNMAYHIFHWERHEELLTNLELIHEKLFSLDKLIKKHYPQLWKHLKMYEADPIIYASSWFITIFCNCFPSSYSFRILECLLLEGQKVIYRVALQLLKMKKKTLKKLYQVESIVEELKNNDELIDPNIDTFFDGMYSINLSRKQINEYKTQFRQSRKKNPLF